MRFSVGDSLGGALGQRGLPSEILGGALGQWGLPSEIPWEIPRGFTTGIR